MPYIEAPLQRALHEYLRAGNRWFSPQGERAVLLGAPGPAITEYLATVIRGAKGPVLMLADEALLFDLAPVLKEAGVQTALAQPSRNVDNCAEQIFGNGTNWDYERYERFFRVLLGCYPKGGLWDERCIKALAMAAATLSAESDGRHPTLAEIRELIKSARMPDFDFTRLSNLEGYTLQELSAVAADCISRLDHLSLSIPILIELENGSVAFPVAEPCGANLCEASFVDRIDSMAGAGATIIVAYPEIALPLNRVAKYARKSGATLLAVFRGLADMRSKAAHDEILAQATVLGVGRVSNTGDARELSTLYGKYQDPYKTGKAALDPLDMTLGELALKYENDRWFLRAQ